MYLVLLLFLCLPCGQMMCILQLTATLQHSVSHFSIAVFGVRKVTYIQEMGFDDKQPFPTSVEADVTLTS
jgi:hypothetical protein